jgi:integrase
MLEAESSARTVRYIHTTLHKALKQAVMDGLIPRNDTEAVKPPQPSREEMRPLTPEQAKLFLQVAHDTGDRLEALKHHLERELGEIDRVSSPWSEHGLIFASDMVAPLNRHNLTRRSFKPLLKRAGIPQVRFHDLRHTCATLLLTRDVNPKIVYQMLGHSSIAITLDTYSHVLPNCGTRPRRRWRRHYRSLLLRHCCQSPRHRRLGLSALCRKYAPLQVIRK